MKTLIIGTIGSPVTLLSTEELEGVKILISYGGGSKETFYAIDLVKNMNNTITIKNIDGRKITITLDYIVMQEPITIIKQVFDTTPRSNYHGKKCNKSTITRYIEMDMSYTKYELVNTYLNNVEIYQINEII
jgi:Zn-dependent alcohol dehydrogenase